MAAILENKTIAITGSGSGIGKAMALACAAEGANIIVADYGVDLAGAGATSDVADATVAEIEAAGGRAVAVAGDVSKFETGAMIVNAAVENFGSIDGVVCVAGILRERMLFKMSEEEFDAVIAVHLKGHFNLYRHAFEVMRKQETGGSIVGITSGAFVASTAQANYSAAKGGIISLTRSAGMTALSVKMRGGPSINANCIAPVALTRMSENVPFEIEMGSPEAIAPMAIHLMSDAGREVNGQTYTVVGPRISVWNQPVEVRTMMAPNGEQWTADEIAANFDQVGQEVPSFYTDLERRMEEMAAKAAAEKAGG